MQRFTFTIAGLALGALLWLVLTGPVGAQSLFERLVMPGDLIEGHAKLQNDCSNCHASFFKSAQATLCLDCHKEIAADIKAGTGFHGRASEVAANDCNHCHTDHIGRDADILLFDKVLFDHSVTDFTLEGKHRTQPCEACHEAGTRFSKAPSQCIDCHRKDDPHGGTFGTDCASCHSAEGWSATRAFDHSKTDFPLDGSHRKIACTSCHTGETGEKLPLDCIGCHAIQDVHHGAMGRKCDSCHSPAKWTEVRFVHERDTSFALEGKHAQATCESCHKTNAYDTTLGVACIDCHRADDPHAGKLGERCESCHKPSGWLADVTFDHDLTRFPLIGQHTLTACEECHVDSVFAGTKTECAACHGDQDKHQGRLGPDCETCHNPNGWAYWLFDHDSQTRFRLTGAHKDLACEACHTARRAKPADTPRACVSCHAGDDVHKGRFGPRCEACHGTDTFKNARLR